MRRAGVILGGVQGAMDGRSRRWACSGAGGAEPEQPAQSTVGHRLWWPGLPRADPGEASCGMGGGLESLEGLSDGGGPLWGKTGERDCGPSVPGGLCSPATLPPSNQQLGWSLVGSEGSADALGRSETQALSSQRLVGAGSSRGPVPWSSGASSFNRILASESSSERK